MSDSQTGEIRPRRASLRDGTAICEYDSPRPITCAARLHSFASALSSPSSTHVGASYPALLEDQHSLALALPAAANASLDHKAVGAPVAEFGLAAFTGKWEDLHAQLWARIEASANRTRAMIEKILADAKAMHSKDARAFGDHDWSAAIQDAIAQFQASVDALFSSVHEAQDSWTASHPSFDWSFGHNFDTEGLLAGWHADAQALVDSFTSKWTSHSAGSRKMMEIGDYSLSGWLSEWTSHDWTGDWLADWETAHAEWNTHVDESIAEWESHTWDLDFEWAGHDWEWDHEFDWSAPEWEWDHPEWTSDWDHESGWSASDFDFGGHAFVFDGFGWGHEDEPER